MYQKTCIYISPDFAWDLIELGFVQQDKEGGKGEGLLKGKDLLSETKVVCQWSLKDKIAQTLTEIKNK